MLSNASTLATRRSAAEAAISATSHTVNATVTTDANASGGFTSRRVRRVRNHCVPARAASTATPAATVHPSPHAASDRSTTYDRSRASRLAWSSASAAGSSSSCSTRSASARASRAGSFASTRARATSAPYRPYPSTMWRIGSRSASPYVMFWAADTSSSAASRRWSTYARAAGPA